MRIIPAIETVYAGRKFRSRLEARWAVFMDTLGLEWLYEHEGYKTKAGLYLPDFYLPSMRLHLEVKPTKEAARDSGKRISAFRDEVGAILVVIGPPKIIGAGKTGNGHPTWEGEGYDLLCWDVNDSSGGSGDFTAFLGADRHGDPVLAIADGRDRSYTTDPCMTEDILHTMPISPHKAPPYAAMGEAFYRAVEAANFARFEHGEHGR